MRKKMSKEGARGTVRVRALQGIAAIGEDLKPGECGDFPAAMAIGYEQKGILEINPDESPKRASQTETA